MPALKTWKCASIALKGMPWLSHTLMQVLPSVFGLIQAPFENPNFS